MRAIIAVINDIFTDQRVLKQESLLKELHFTVNIIGRRLKGSTELPGSLLRNSRFKLLFRKGPGMYLAFNVRLFFFLLYTRADLYIANDLDTLLPCFLISRLFRKPLIYDSHEYFTGQHGLAERRLKYYLWKCLEKRLIPRLKCMLTVSNSIADLYFNEYGIKPVVIRNLSPSSIAISARSRSELGIRKDELLVVLQGSGINPGRGVGELVEAMALTEGVRLLIIGGGDTLENIRYLTALKGVTGKVTFLPRMPWEMMMSYTKCCDAGLSLDKDTCINQRYSLPNKLFDYISAGIPVIASNLQEVAGIINDYGCGIILEDVKPDVIAAALRRLREDNALLISLKSKAVSASTVLNWENERRIELDLFRSVIYKNN